MLKEIKSTEDYLIHLVYALLHGVKPSEKPENIPWEDVFHLALKHSIANMVYYAVEQLEGKPDDALFKRWEEVKYKGIIRDIKQRNELRTVCEAFSIHGVRCLPLKGCITKQYYPQSDWRMMSDLDMLIDVENASKVRKILLDMGYTCKMYNKTHHDIYVKDGMIYLEIHRELLNRQLKKAYAYYQDGFSLSHPQKDRPYVYEMTPEDFYIYHIVHFCKHYRGHGSGIRSLIDTYILRTTFQDDWDDSYVERVLDDLGILPFEKEMTTISQMWFGQAEVDSAYEEDIAFLYSSGTYGTKENSIHRDLKEKGIWKYLFQRIFKPYDEMIIVYPVLKKCPFLLPGFWVFRLITGVTLKQKKIKHEIKTMKNAHTYTE